MLYWCMAQQQSSRFHPPINCVRFVCSRKQISWDADLFGCRPRARLNLFRIGETKKKKNVDSMSKRISFTSDDWKHTRHKYFSLKKLYAGSYVNQHKIGSSVLIKKIKFQKTMYGALVNSYFILLLSFLRCWIIFVFCTSASNGKNCVSNAKRKEERKKKNETRIVMRFYSVRVGRGNCGLAITYIIRCDFVLLVQWIHVFWVSAAECDAPSSSWSTSV